MLRADIKEKPPCGYAWINAQYPALGIHPKVCMVVLFHNFGRGYVLYPGASNHEVGGGGDSPWMMDQFEPFEGSVTVRT